MAFGLGPVLTMAGVDALVTHGSDALKRAYLPKLVSGEWMGTMQLTEPQAGSDVGALRTKAERVADGSYRITGQKIFITYGEHDLTDNIIHLVLARLPDAPPGTKGISLFLVPKFLLNADGSPGQRNDARAHSIEHKLGIHASPTCTMVYGDRGGATGFLIGEENRGMACMFTMMNQARLSVALQGVAIAERATQQALAYARERRQGRANGAPSGSSPIIAHPDVKRMLLTMRALTRAARAISYATAVAIDRAQRSPDDAARSAAHERASLLTPIAKAFSTDIGNEVASLGVQVHGGMGYVEETGAAQHYRDARITPIYEGTNGIQAIDLVTRKLPLAGGVTVRAYLSEIRRTVEAVNATNDPAFGWTGVRLQDAVDSLQRATDWLLGGQHNDPDPALAGATPYLRLFALAAGGALLAEEALAAKRLAGNGARCRGAHRHRAFFCGEPGGAGQRSRAHRGRGRRQRQPCGRGPGLEVLPDRGARQASFPDRGIGNASRPRRSGSRYELKSCPLKTTRSSSPAHRAASGLQLRCAPRATAPTSPLPPRPTSRIRSWPAPSSPPPTRSPRRAAMRCPSWSMCATRRR